MSMAASRFREDGEEGLRDGEVRSEGRRRVTVALRFEIVSSSGRGGNAVGVNTVFGCRLRGAFP